MMTAKGRLAMATTAIVLLTGCAGGDGGGADVDGRPSADDIAASIEGGTSGLGVAPSQADCAAKVVVDSDMSDGAIAGYLPPDHPRYRELPDGRLSDSDRMAFDEVVAALETECGLQLGAG